MNNPDPSNFRTELRDYEVEIVASKLILVRNAPSEEVAIEYARQAAESVGFDNIQTNALPVLETEFEVVADIEI